MMMLVKLQACKKKLKMTITTINNKEDTDMGTIMTTSTVAAEAVT